MPAGRPRGSPNKQSWALQKYVEEKGQGVSPGKVMLDRMWFHFSLAGEEMRRPGRNNDLIAKELAAAADAAEKVAPYVHTRLSSVVFMGDEDNPLVHDHRIREEPAVLTQEQLEALPEHELIRLYRSKVSALIEYREEPSGGSQQHPAGNGKVSP